MISHWMVNKFIWLLFVTIVLFTAVALELSDTDVFLERCLYCSMILCLIHF